MLLMKMLWKLGLNGRMVEWIFLWCIEFSRHEKTLGMLWIECIEELKPTPPPPPEIEG
jgi:hypothetical protein